MRCSSGSDRWPMGAPASGGRGAGAAGLRVLHRLQRAEDAAHRAARARHHGCARRQLSGHGRADPLLRRDAAAHGRHRDVTAAWPRRRSTSSSQEQERTGARVVPDLRRAVHRNHAAARSRRTRGTRPFEMTPFMLFLRARLDAVAPAAARARQMRIALHRHPGAAGVMEAAAEMLQRRPGIELVDLSQPAVGLMSNYLRDAARLQARAPAQRARSRARCRRRRAGRGLSTRTIASCARTSADWPFQIMNVLEIVGASMGLQQRRPLQAAQAHAGRRCDPRRLRRSRDAQHGLDPATSRKVIAAMLADQPLAMRGEV